MNRWVPIHSSLYSHLTTGRLSPKAFVALLRMFDLADYKSGIWDGCAIALAAACGPAYDVSGTQKILNTLEKGGFLKRFRSPAQRGNYPIAIGGYICTAGVFKDKYVVLGNARCEEDLIYEARGAEPVKEPPVQSAPTVALHPDVAKLEQLFTDADKTVHPASRAAMSKFLTEEKYDLAYLTGMLNFAFATEFWSKRILKWEGFEQFYRKGTLGKQYRAWRKKTKKAAPAPVPTPPVLFEKKPDDRTTFKPQTKKDAPAEKPHPGIANFLQPNWLSIEEDDDEDEDMVFLHRAEKLAAGN